MNHIVGRRRIWRRLCTVLLGSIISLAILVSGCSSDEDKTASSASPSPGIGLSSWRGQASALSDLLFRFTSSAIRWSDEPTGDVQASRLAAGPVVFAVVSRASAQSRTVSFDALQLFTGEAAAEESSRDGKGAPPNPYYVRNAHRHLQTLPLAASCVIAQYAEEDGLVPGPLVAISTDEFCGRLASGSPRHCWLVIDGDEVVAVLEELSP